MTRHAPPSKSKAKAEAKSGVQSEAKCPICGRPGVETYRPFCSRRCADVDLARWLGGGYAIPVADGDDDEDGSQPAGEARQDETGTKH
jgi:endogenous inhibitor of DNA gyrase (YacG/DUF329 family)